MLGKYMTFCPTKRQWRRWSLPSKLTAIGVLISIVGIAVTLALFLASRDGTERGTDVEDAAVPAVALELRNPTTTSVTIRGRGDAVFWLPAGVGGGAPNVTGKYDLSFDTAPGSAVDSLTIEPLSTANVYAHLSSATQVAELLRAGSTDLSLLLRREDGSVIRCGSIPFDESRIISTRWQIDVAPR
jgi:hypothetical protein